MGLTTIICPRCKALVDVDGGRIVAEHESGDGVPCELSGLRYAPSAIHKLGAGGPQVQVLGSKDVKVSCTNCGEDHDGIMPLLRITPPDASVN